MFNSFPISVSFSFINSNKQTYRCISLLVPGSLRRTLDRVRQKRVSIESQGCYSRGAYQLLSRVILFYTLPAHLESCLKQLALLCLTSAHRGRVFLWGIRLATTYNTGSIPLLVGPQSILSAQGRILLQLDCMILLIQTSFLVGGRMLMTIKFFTMLYLTDILFCIACKRVVKHALALVVLGCWVTIIFRLIVIFWLIFILYIINCLVDKWST